MLEDEVAAAAEAGIFTPRRTVEAEAE